MPEDVQSTASQTQNTEQNQSAVPAEVAKLMELSLNGPQQQQSQQEAVQANTQEQGQQESTSREGQQSTPFTFDILKEKFGYDSPEVALQEIENLRKLKDNPPQAVQIKYENEQSEKIAKALQAGKLKEVYETLHEQSQLDRITSLEVNKDTANDIIKLSMQIKYKAEGLTPDEIEYKFKKTYGIPKEPKGDADDEDFIEKHNEWKEIVADVEAGKIIDAKVAKRELEAAKSKIVFPEVAQTVDEGYLQYKKDLEEQPAIVEAMKGIFKTFTPKSLETKANFNDETNKVAFQFQYEPDVESFNKSVEMAIDSTKFMDTFKKSDGTFDNQKYLSAIHFATNMDKIIMEAMKQAKNGTLKSKLPDNSQGGTQRIAPQDQTQLTELDKQMQLSLNGYGQRRTA